MEKNRLLQSLIWQMSSNEPCLEILQQKYLLRVTCFTNEVQITVITFGSLVRSFVKKIDFTNSRGLFSVLESPKELLKMLKDLKDYRYSFEENSLMINWRVVCHGFEKDVCQKIVLEQEELNEVKKLQWQVMILKSKLQKAEIEKEKIKPFLIRLQNRKQLIQDEESKESPKMMKKAMEDNKTARAEENKDQNESPKLNKNKMIKKALPLKQKPIRQYITRKERLKTIKTKLASRKNEEEQQNAQDEAQSLNKDIQMKKVSIQKKIQDKNSIQQIMQELNTKKCRIDFPNGDFYYGQMKDGLYHGIGQLHSKEKGIYSGQWRNGKKQIFGKLIDSDECTYEGDFKNDMKHGRGKQIYANGESFIGNFFEDYRTGYGIYYYENGDKYEGEWKNDLYHGFGKQISKNGTVYEGFWYKDEKDGEGILKNKRKKVKQVWKRGKLLREEIIYD